MKRFHSSIDRWGHLVVPAIVLLFIIGFHELPVLWIPLVVIFVAVWIMGVRSDRKRRSRGQR